MTRPDVTPPDPARLDRAGPDGVRPRTLPRLATAIVVAILVVVAGGCSSGEEATVPTTVAPPPVETTTTTEVPIDGGEQVFIYEPAVGDCFDLRKLDQPSSSNDDQVDIVLLLDCTLPHKYEVFDVVTYPNEAGAYPGEAALEAFANQNCTKNFEAYVGQIYELSELGISFRTTPEDRWDTEPQALACTLYQPSSDPAGARLIGPTAGSAR